MKNITVVCAVLSLSSCAAFNSSRPGQEPAAKTVTETIHEHHWITPPKSNQLVIIGVSGRQSKGLEAEIQLAREDAAKKVSMYYGLYAEVENAQYVGPGFLDVAFDTRINVEYDGRIEQYIDKLAFDPERDVYDRGNAVYVRFTYPESFSGNISYNRFDENPNGSPKWTTSPPREISGFPAGIGVARRQQMFRDSIMKSFESAAASLVSNMSASVSTGDISTSTASATSTRQHSSGRLTHFLILETWIDPVSEAVWTLAVARSAN